jgi:hypothetical protein
MPAQGRAQRRPGYEAALAGLSPVGATQAWAVRRPFFLTFFGSPLQGLIQIKPKPRALPWAGMGLPLWGEEQGDGCIKIISSGERAGVRAGFPRTNCLICFAHLLRL